MKTAVASLKSISPYEQSKFYQTPMLKRELKKDYEARTWRDRLHINLDGNEELPLRSGKV